MPLGIGKFSLGYRLRSKPMKRGKGRITLFGQKMKTLSRIFVSVFVFAVTSCACHFSPTRSEEITPQQFVAIYHVEPLDQMLYFGSDSIYHYFFRARPMGGGSFRIKRSLFRLPEEFPLSEGRKPLFLVGRFDEKSASWLEK